MGQEKMSLLSPVFLFNPCTLVADHRSHPHPRLFLHTMQAWIKQAPQAVYVPVFLPNAGIPILLILSPFVGVPDRFANGLVTLEVDSLVVALALCIPGAGDMVRGGGTLLVLLAGVDVAMEEARAGGDDWVMEPLDEGLA